MNWISTLKDMKHAATIGRLSRSSYFLTLVLFGLLTILPVLASGGREMILTTGRTYFFWFLLYWAAAAMVFSLLTAWQKYKAFDRPMRILGEAARKVAQGDFTVRIAPLHASKPQSYVDTMFLDFNKMVEELESVTIMKEDFISNVSHEFKTPLSVIINYTQELQDPNLDETERQEYLGTVITSAKKLNELVANVLRLSKMTHQAIPLERQSFDLCRQLCDCVIAFENKWDAKDIDFGVDVEEHLMVCESEEVLALVWNNLISNAIKFTPRGGMITLQQTSNAENIIVQVMDSGCGMDENTMRHVFDKFYQGDTSRSKDGNGLGLALVKKAVELLGGSVSVASTLGKGSTFTVVLPRRQPIESGTISR